jgi:hypothetical protein
MQLTLLDTFAPRAAGAGPSPPRRAAATSRDAVALSQLDLIAAQNLRAPAHGLGSAGMLLALLGGLVVLGSASMWNGAATDASRDSRASRAPQAQAVVESRPAVAVAPVVAQAITPTFETAMEPTLPAQAAPELAPAPVAAADAAADDAARKARVKQLAEARRKAALVAQERAQAEESQRLQLAQQREAERAQQLAEQARQRAAEQARAQPVQFALDTRHSVSDSCSGAGSVISRQFCRARECAKPEHQGDPVCVSRRDEELAQERASINR